MSAKSHLRQRSARWPFIVEAGQVVGSGGIRAATPYEILGPVLKAADKAERSIQSFYPIEGSQTAEYETAVTDARLAGIQHVSLCLASLGSALRDCFGLPEDPNRRFVNHGNLSLEQNAAVGILWGDVEGLQTWFSRHSPSRKSVPNRIPALPKNLWAKFSQSLTAFRKAIPPPAPPVALDQHETASDGDILSTKNSAAGRLGAGRNKAVLGPGSQGNPPESAKTRKRSSAKGEARAKIIGALTLHHKYQDGGCLNLEPIGVNELARKAEVAQSSVSDFFDREFNKGGKGGHAKYKIACNSPTQLVAAIKLLNGEYAPSLLFGGNPPGEVRRRRITAKIRDFPMTPTDPDSILVKLLALAAETEWVEFKEARTTFDFEKLGRYFSALSNEANLKGKPWGWLVLGVTNEVPRQVVGTKYKAGRPELDALKKGIADQTSNRLTFEEIHEVTRPDGRVLLFQIPPAPRGMPVAFQGHYYGREGESLSPLSIHEIEQIRKQRPHED